MGYIEESDRKVPILAETEVLVISGGPAGISAAISIKNQTTYRNVDIIKVKETLESQGVRMF